MSSGAHDRPAIVIVEDEPDVLRVLKRLLTVLYRDHDILTASNGSEALQYIHSRPIELIITDYTMPEMNGLDLATTVKQMMPATRIVLVTAYATPEVERMARKAGVDYFLAKPFQIDQVEDVVRRALGERP